MKYIYFSICLIVMNSALFSKEYAKIFLIKSITNTHNKTCSASLLKINNTCSLFTNFHCVSDALETYIVPVKPISKDSKILNDYRQYFATNWSDLPIKIGVIKSNHYLDIAQLNIPNKLSKLYCSNLKNHDFDSSIKELRATSTKRATLGFLNKRPKVNNISVGILNPEQAALTGKLIRAISGKFFIFYNDIEMNIGMSGGIIIDPDIGVIHGLLSQFIPYQRKLFAIPMAEIINFTKSGDSSELAYNSKLSFNGQMFGNHITPLVNSHSKMNPYLIKNEHGEGEDRNIPDVRFDTDTKIMDKFAADDEGVLLGLGISILGFTTKRDNCPSCKGLYHQIDGHVDFYYKIADKKYLKKYFPNRQIDQYISRIIDYPTLDIRKNIIKRLNGKYGYRGYDNRKKCGPRNDDDSYCTSFGTNLDQGASLHNQREYLFIKSKSNPTGLDKFMEGTTNNYIEVDYRNGYIIFDRYTDYLVKTNKDGTKAFDADVPPNVRFVFKIKHDKEYKQFYLEDMAGGPLAERLVCENRNLLKLVCKSSKMIFSLSLNHTGKKRIMKYRFARIEDLSKKLIIYSFGNILETDRW